MVEYEPVEAEVKGEDEVTINDAGEGNVIIIDYKPAKRKLKQLTIPVAMKLEEHQKKEERHACCRLMAAQTRERKDGLDYSKKDARRAEKVIQTETKIEPSDGEDVFTEDLGDFF